MTNFYHKQNVTTMYYKNQQNHQQVLLTFRSHLGEISYL